MKRPTLNRTVVVCVVVAALASVAGAQSKRAIARAEALNAQGKARIQVVDFEGAAALFRSAIELVPDPRYYFNLCLTLDLAGKLREARTACEMVAAGGADARLADKAQERLTKINQAIGDGPAGDGAPGGGAARPSDGLAAGGAGASTSPPTTTSPAITTGAPPATAGGEPAATTAAVGDRPGHTYSIRLAAGASTIVGDGIDLDTILAGAIGGGALLWFGEVALQLEGLVARRGATATFTDGSGSQTDTYTYLDLVSAARYELRGRRVRPYGLGGLYGGFKLTATGEFSDGTSVDAGATTSLDLGLVVGGGAAFGGYHRALSLDVRFQQGFINLDDSDVAPKHRVFLLMAGYEI